MAANKKLTAVIGGRIIAGACEEGGKLFVTFKYGSTMSIKVAELGQQVPVDGTVQKVRQEDAKLSLDMVGGSTDEADIAEATSSVMVRHRKGGMAYAE